MKIISSFISPDDKDLGQVETIETFFLYNK